MELTVRRKLAELDEAYNFVHTRHDFSATFTSADKSHLKYPYLTCGIDKKEKQHVLSIHWLYRRSRNSVVKTLGVDVIVTSHMTSTFNMVDVNA